MIVEWKSTYEIVFVCFETNYYFEVKSCNFVILKKQISTSTVTRTPQVNSKYNVPPT